VAKSYSSALENTAFFTDAPIFQNVLTLESGEEKMEKVINEQFQKIQKYPHYEEIERRTREQLVMDTGPEQFFYLPSGNAPYHG
jgi:hypothetical protein